MKSNKLLWLYLLMNASLVAACRAYSFSGTNLPVEVRTFSIDSCEAKVAKGPPDIAERFLKNFADSVTQRTGLNQRLQEGDVQYNITIVKFEVSPAATKAGGDTGSIQRLTIDVEVDYVNNLDEKSALKKKKFSQFADTSEGADIDAEESRLMEEVFEKLASDIMNETVTSW